MKMGYRYMVFQGGRINLYAHQDLSDLARHVDYYFQYHATNPDLHPQIALLSDFGVSDCQYVVASTRAPGGFTYDDGWGLLLSYITPGVTFTLCNVAPWVERPSDADRPDTWDE